jgi:predicted SAM-dependent methyltransferase
VNSMLKLHVGCGDVYLEGWVNIDVESSKADVKHDLQTSLPYDDSSASFIYSEHFIEHLAAEAGANVLKEFYRVLKAGGVLRIATPDLRYLMKKYFLGWKSQDWIKTYGYGWLQTRAEMINLCFRGWGHQYLYDREELERRLREAGFKRLRNKRFGESDYEELRGKETRRDSKLILEAVK